MKKTDIAGDPVFLLIDYKEEFGGNVYRLYPWNSEAANAHWETIKWLRDKKTKKEKAQQVGDK